MPAPHHMLGYIRESPQALRCTLADNEAPVGETAARAAERGIERVIVFGTGSSFTAAMMAAPAFRYHCPLPVYVLPASEVVDYAPRLLDERSLAVGVSRSGERRQVVDAMAECAARGALCVSMTGTSDSLLAQSGDIALLTSEGPEITFPKTKSVVAGAGLLMRLALALGTQDDEGAARLGALNAMPRDLELTLEAIERQLPDLMPSLVAHTSVLISGTGSNYGTALEGAMKIAESAYVPVCSNDTGNLLHGAVGVLTQQWLTILLVTRRDLEVSRRTLDLVGKFGTHRLSIVEPGPDLAGLTDYSLQLPLAADPFLAALPYLLPLQLIAYHWAVARGLDPDAPGSMQATLAAILAPGRQEPELRQ